MKIPLPRIATVPLDSRGRWRRRGRAACARALLRIGGPARVAVPGGARHSEQDAARLRPRGEAIVVGRSSDVGLRPRSATPELDAACLASPRPTPRSCPAGRATAGRRSCKQSDGDRAEGDSEGEPGRPGSPALDCEPAGERGEDDCRDDESNEGKWQSGYDSFGRPTGRAANGRRHRRHAQQRETPQNGAYRQRE